MRQRAAASAASDGHGQHLICFVLKVTAATVGFREFRQVDAKHIFTNMTLIAAVQCIGGYPALIWIVRPECFAASSATVCMPGTEGGR